MDHGLVKWRSEQDRLGSGTRSTEAQFFLVYHSCQVTFKRKKLIKIFSEQGLDAYYSKDVLSLVPVLW